MTLEDELSLLLDRAVALDGGAEVEVGTADAFEAEACGGTDCAG